MSMPKLLGSVIVFGALSVVLIAMLWWRYSVDEKLGYCQTPEQTCINRQGFALGEPCECHGMGGGVFGLELHGQGGRSAIAGLRQFGNVGKLGAPDKFELVTSAFGGHCRCLFPFTGIHTCGL